MNQPQTTRFQGDVPQSHDPPDHSPSPLPQCTQAHGPPSNDPEPKHEPVLLIGFGNPGRLDDGLGAAVVQAVAGRPGVHAEHDYQLNIEHATLIAAHKTVIFADAAPPGAGPCIFRRLLPRNDQTFSSHIMRPESLLAVAYELFGFNGRAYLLGVRGREFNQYEERLSNEAKSNLAETLQRLSQALENDDLDDITTAGPIDDSAAACNGGATCKTQKNESCSSTMTPTSAKPCGR